jgi:putative ATPase
MPINPDSRPLAERMRPKRIEDFFGQHHLTSENGILRRVIETGSLPSMIFWGPPGVGKTTLAGLLAEQLQRPFHALSAIHSGVKDVREAINESEKQNLFSSKGRPIVFIDEIHRFNKSQQDALLGAVESGTITLIGATTENPSFEVNHALLSRCQVYVLENLSDTDLIGLMQRALNEDAWLKQFTVQLQETDALLRYSGGDARKLLNALELVIQHAGKTEVTITNEMVAASIQKNMVAYDKTGEQHYDIISAFIKSIRGSDPNAAVYWLARMVAGGEDPIFIARRMLILASEDIGNANPNALLLANTTMQAVHAVGWPESRIILSQCAVYLACSAKSNASYMAINHASAAVEQTGDLPVPLHLRNAPTKLMKDLNYGKDYAYAHQYEGNFVHQEFLPEALSGTPLYQPGQNPRENEFRQFLKSRWGDKYGY